MTESSQHDARAAGAPTARLPLALRLLFLGAEEPAWAPLTLELDRHGCRQPEFRWCAGLVDGARELGRERFDCIVVDDIAGAASGDGAADSGRLLAEIAALRAAGCDDPVLVLSDRIDDDWLTAVAAGELELLVTPHGWRSTALVPWVIRAIDRRRLAVERAEFGAAGERRQQREAGESWSLLDQRLQLAARLRAADPPGRGCRSTSPDDLAAAWRELLRAYIVAGPGTLEREIAAYASAAASAGATAADLLDRHVAAVEQLLSGLGSRSSRHVIQQSDLLLLETLARFSSVTGPR